LIIRTFIRRIDKWIISDKEFQKFICMMQRYQEDMPELAEIAVDLLSKMIKYSRALTKVGEKILCHDKRSLI